MSRIEQWAVDASARILQLSLSPDVARKLASQLGISYQHIELTQERQYIDLVSERIVNISTIRREVPALIVE
jgi:hypothetical protein